MMNATPLPGFESSHQLAALPVRERPVGRLYHVGPQALSLTELLAAIIGGPQQLEIAQQIVTTFGDTLGQVLPAELQQIPGLGSAGVARLQAALELGRRMAAPVNRDRPQITQPGDAAEILIPLIGDRDQEHFVVMHLDTRNRVLDTEILYKGSLNCSLVRVAEIFRGAIRRNCAAVIVAHNHPSGDPLPSPEDVALTRRLVEAGKLMEVDVLDHVVIGRNRYISLRERGLGFEGAVV